MADPTGGAISVQGTKPPDNTMYVVSRTPAPKGYNPMILTTPEQVQAQQSAQQEYQTHPEEFQSIPIGAQPAGQAAIASVQPQTQQQPQPQESMVIGYEDTGTQQSVLFKQSMTQAQFDAKYNPPAPSPVSTVSQNIYQDMVDYKIKNYAQSVVPQAKVGLSEEEFKAAGGYDEWFTNIPNRGAIGNQQFQKTFDEYGNNPLYVPVDTSRETELGKMVSEAAVFSLGVNAINAGAIYLQEPVGQPTIRGEVSAVIEETPPRIRGGIEGAGPRFGTEVRIGGNIEQPQSRLSSWLGRTPTTKEFTFDELGIAGETVSLNGEASQIAQSSNYNLKVQDAAIKIGESAKVIRVISGESSDIGMTSQTASAGNEGASTSRLSLSLQEARPAGDFDMEGYSGTAVIKGGTSGQLGVRVVSRLLSAPQEAIPLEDFSKPGAGKSTFTLKDVMEMSAAEEVAPSINMPSAPSELPKMSELESVSAPAPNPMRQPSVEAITKGALGNAMKELGTVVKAPESSGSYPSIFPQFPGQNVGSGWSKISNPNFNSPQGIIGNNKLGITPSTKGAGKTALSQAQSQLQGQSSISKSGLGLSDVTDISFSQGSTGREITGTAMIPIFGQGSLSRQRQDQITVPRPTPPGSKTPIFSDIGSSPPSPPPPGGFSFPGFKLGKFNPEKKHKGLPRLLGGISLHRKSRKQGEALGLISEGISKRLYGKATLPKGRLSRIGSSPSKELLGAGISSPGKYLEMGGSIKMNKRSK